MRISLLCAAIPLTLGAASSQAAGIFDEPIKTEKVAITPDPLNPQAKAELSCFHYKGFVVKQIDRGEVGAQSLSIVAGKAFVCAEAQQAGEYVIPTEQWSGYFLGAKGDHVFFSAPDGVNGGQGFAVFNTITHAKLFEDLAQGPITEATAKDDTLTLGYSRVYAGNCSVITAGAECAVVLEKSTGLAASSFSICAQGYAKGKDAMAAGRCEAKQDKSETCLADEKKIIETQKWDESPTVLVYNAQVFISPAAPVVTARSDVALSCRPAD